MGILRTWIPFVAASAWFLTMAGMGADSARAGSDCTICHTMPPVDSAVRNPRTGGTVGNHLTHQPAGATGVNCAVCHTGAATFTTGHRDGAIALDPNLNSSPSGTGRYIVDGKTVTFKNQTTLPRLGSCSSVNCHFETATPTWGAAQFKYTSTASNDCNKCHGAPPAGTGPSNTGGAAGSHARHDVYYSGIAQCKKCHPDHLAETARFAHATSAGNRNLIVRPLSPQDVVGGSYGGAVNDYLPSQQNSFGSCTNAYCHSTGNTAVSATNLPLVYGGTPYAAPVWGSGALSCKSCHGRSTNDGMPDYNNAGTPGSATANSHVKHVDSSAISCGECHNRTTKTGTSIRLTSYHVNGERNVFFNLSGANKNGSYNNNAKTCSATYCHGSSSAVAWGGTTSCVSCHGATFTTFSSLAKKGAHSMHIEANTLPASFTGSGTGNLSASATTYQFGCASCHSPAGASHANSESNANGGAAEVFFGYTTAVVKGTYIPGTLQAGTDNGFKWTAGTGCNTSYCHSNGQNAPGRVDVAWNAAKNSLGCDACHGNAASNTLSGKHAQHVSVTANPALGAGNAFGCVQCHAKTVSGDTTISNKMKHVNKYIDYSGARAGGSAKYSSATKRCAGIYCHSNGNPRAIVYADPSAWNSTSGLGCNGCHGIGNSSTGAPDYTNGGANTATANSHVKHVAGNGITDTTGCAACHAKTVNQSVVNRFKDYSAAKFHINGTPDVLFKELAGKTGTWNGSTCSNTYCHGGAASAAWGTATALACNSCHSAKANDTYWATNSAHRFHWEGSTLPTSYTAAPGNTTGDAATYRFSCSSCHGKTSVHADGPANGSGAAEVFFGYTSGTMKGNYSYGATQGTADNGFTWTAGTGCNTSYCHSNGQGAAGRINVAWNTASLGCDGCHGDGMSTALSGKHAQHVSVTTNPNLGAGNAFGCANCHAKTVSNGTAISDKRRHVNKFIDYSSPQGGGSLKFNSLTKKCANIYCHSNGNTGSIAYVDAPAWNSTVTLDCNGCHGTGNAIGAPDYANGGTGISANSHARHVSGATDTTVCSDCHIKTVSATVAGRFKDYSAAKYHLSNKPDVNFDASVAGATASWSAATGQCSNVTCHGGNPISWGGTAYCKDCHGGTADQDNFTGTFWNNGVAGKIKLLGEWDTTGHGKATGTYASGSAAANFGVEAKECEYCHDPAIGHKLSSNPFRLRNYSTAAWGRNAVCQNCHATGSAGITVGATLKNSTRKVGSDHSGAKHTTAKNGGQFCWDCHDGHGDTNVYMIHNTVASVSNRTTSAPVTTVATTFTAFATGTDYAKNAAPYTGVCQVCHDSTVNHYTATSGNNHNSGTRCTSCHTHTGATKSTAFPGSESSGGAPCLGCHSAGYSAMNSNASYHHYMQNDTATYSNTATPTATDTNRRCLMCHVDHNIFRPDINANGTRAKNLRTGATDAVSATAGFTNSDFDGALTSGGVCVSCHTNQQTKNLTNRKADGTTVTPVITKADYTGTAHNYAVAGAAFSDTSKVNANCIKCHDAQNGESSQQSNFGNHDSTTRSLFGALGGTLTDPYESELCYRCHSNAADAIGGTRKTANANDWYGAVTTMSTHATGIFQVFQKANKHQVDLAAYNGKHKPNAVDESRAYISNPANKHIGCSDCHNSHAATAANPTKGSMGVNPTNSTVNWTAPTAYANLNIAGGDDEYKICFRCHSGYNTGLASWNSTWTDVSKEFSTNNKSFHWVEGDKGTAPKADTTYGNFNKNYVYKMMPRYAGFTDAQLRTVKMRCSDCHGSDNAENNPNGPHGSTYARMLKVPVGSPYTAWNSTSQVGGSNVWCFNCHEPTFTNSGFRGGDGSLHTSKHNGNKGPCMDCHVKIPHGYQVPHLLKPLSMPAGDAAYNGSPGNGIDLPLNSTNWGLSGRWTENSCGSHQNCSGS